MRPYSSEFYENRHGRTVHSAEVILSLVTDKVGKVSSAVDVGCGVGTWLSVLRQRGVSDILGLDGPWVDHKLLSIPADHFQQADLSKLEPLPRRFDLAISLEVAEHLPIERAASFVDLLTRAADNVLFSAAIPLQGGRNHVNEQWQAYWVDLFAQKGFGAHDFIRPKIWSDDRIPYWYRQNVIFYSRRGTTADGNASQSPDASSSIFNLVHPTLYMEKALRSKKRGIRLIPRALKRYLKGKSRAK